MKSDLMFSSKPTVWVTPQDFFDKLNSIFHFTTDVCALPDNAKCDHYYTPDQDGLRQTWAGSCFMNPPYGRKVGEWIEKAYWSAKQNGTTVVCLVPARVDTRWWHDYCARAVEIYFVKGRLRFGNAQHNAPFPSAVVVFGPTIRDAFEEGNCER